MSVLGLELDVTCYSILLLVKFVKLLFYLEREYYILGVLVLFHGGRVVDVEGSGALI